MSETRYKWEKYNWWIICIIIFIAVFVILYYVHPNTDQDNARYILSAISQGLAAILALVFTITLVVSQMTRRYTAMDKIIFRHETIILMIVFGFGVVTPLLVLKRGFWGWDVNLSIAIAFFCVFSLIPFLKGVNSVLKYDIGIVNLNEEIMEAIELGYKPRISKIRELNEIGESAIKESREDVTSKIIQFLSEIGKKSIEKEMEDITYRAVGSLSELGKGAAENNWERVTRIKTVTGLATIGKQSIEKKWKYVILSVINGLISIGVISARKGWKGVVRHASGFLEEVSVNVNFAFTEEGLNSAAGLWILGAAVEKEKYLIEIVNERIHELREWKKSTSNDFFEKAFNRAREDINEHYPDLKPSFEEFKRHYDDR